MIFVLRDCIYLETTALIDSVLKGWNPELVAILSSADKISTSQYAQMEIKRGFLHNWVLLYNKVIQYQNLSQLNFFISRLHVSGFHRYYLGACLDALTLFTVEYEKKRPKEIAGQYEEIDKEKKQLEIFKSILRSQIKRCFHKINNLVAENYNPMSCFVDIDSPIEQKGMFEDRPHKCNGSVKRCAIEKYFRNNKGLFEKILNKLKLLEKKDQATERRISSLREILKLVKLNRPFSNHDQNEELCWNCGDAIHAVIPPSEDTIITSNARHFKPICEELDKPYKGYKSP